jgi:hypothetical protein
MGVGYDANICRVIGHDRMRMRYRTIEKRYMGDVEVGV